VGFWCGMDFNHVVVFRLYDPSVEKKSRKTKRIDLRSSFTFKHWMESCIFSIASCICWTDYFTRPIECNPINATQKFRVKKLEFDADFTLL
jgi:hypothetical protein